MKTKLFSIGGLILIVATLIVSREIFFTVDETEQVIITQFGEYKRTIQQPGLAFKLPFIQTVNRFDRRILVSDAPQAEYLTQDKKRLVADPITRWRITDPLLFYKTVREESGARARLDDLVFSELRQEVARHTFAAVIGTKREPIMDAVAATAREKAREFGIEVVDVRIKRADLPLEVQASVFARHGGRARTRGQTLPQRRRGGSGQTARPNRQGTHDRAGDGGATSAVLRGDGDAEATAHLRRRLWQGPGVLQVRAQPASLRTVRRQAQHAGALGRLRPVPLPRQSHPAASPAP